MGLDHWWGSTCRPRRSATRDLPPGLGRKDGGIHWENLSPALGKGVRGIHRESSPWPPQGSTHRIPQFQRGKIHRGQPSGLGRGAAGIPQRSPRCGEGVWGSIWGQAPSPVGGGREGFRKDPPSLGRGDGGQAARLGGAERGPPTRGHRRGDMPSLGQRVPSGGGEGW